MPFQAIVHVGADETAAYFQVGNETTPSLDPSLASINDWKSADFESEIW